MIGPGWFFSGTMWDACKITVDHILSFRDNFRIAPRTTLPPCVLKTPKHEHMFFQVCRLRANFSSFQDNFGLATPHPSILSRRQNETDCFFFCKHPKVEKKPRRFLDAHHFFQEKNGSWNKNNKKKKKTQEMCLGSFSSSRKK